MSMRAATPKRTTWNTYAEFGYSYDVANHPQSQGGMHYHQVRRTRRGYWQRRILQSNGFHEACGPVTPITAQEGEALWAQVVED